jgi:hypothetical protein
LVKVGATHTASPNLGTGYPVAACVTFTTTAATVPPSVDIVTVTTRKSFVRCPRTAIVTGTTI